MPLEVIPMSNAGHNPPIVLRKKSGEIEELDLTGLAVGSMDDSEYTQEELPLSPGDVIVLYTDDITDAINDREEMYEVPQLIETIRKNGDSSSQEIVDEIIRSVFTFTGSQPQFDDITLKRWLKKENSLRRKLRAVVDDTILWQILLS